MKTYIKLPKATERANYIRIDVDYNKGGDCYSGGKANLRGYYMTVCPVLRDGIFESFVCYTGARILLKEVSRKSAKQEAEAIEIAKNTVKSTVEYVCKKNGLEIPEEIAI